MATVLLERRPTTTPPTVRVRRWPAILAAAAAATLILGARLPGAVGERMATVALAFTALVAESLPFLLAGAVIVGLLRGSAGRRLLRAAATCPRLAAVLAPVSGLALPLCDCGLVPLARRLRSSGATRAVVNGFVAGAPITNPIVILSTIVAFPGSPGMVVGRLVAGLGVAALVSSLGPTPRPGPACHPDHDTDGPPGVKRSIADELGRTGPTLVLGALAAGLIKGLVPTDVLASLGAQPLFAALAMMALAFLMAICSQADAFVAASLPVGNLARLAFLVMGPMMDIRLAALYRREFGSRWLAGYAAVLVPAVLVLTTVWATWGLP